MAMRKNKKTTYYVQREGKLGITLMATITGECERVARHSAQEAIDHFSAANPEAHFFFTARPANWWKK
jgi:hypothetical protein